jgi:YVTN family beta-propeller protein
MKHIRALIIPLCFAVAPPPAGAQQASSLTPTRGTGIAYVTNGGDSSGNNGSVSLVDTETLKVVATLPTGGAPLGLAFTPDGDLVYIADDSSNTVSVWNAKTLGLVDTVTVVSNPGNLAATPDGASVYVLSLSSGAASVIDTKTNSVTATISVSTQSLLSIAIRPDGRFAYATHCCADNNVTVIDTKSNTVVTQIPLGGGPSGIAVTPDGRFVIVEDLADVSVIDTRTNTVVATIAGAGGCGPTVAITPDGKLAYAEDYCDNRVTVIDARTLEVVTTLSINTPIGAAFSPGGSLIYILLNNCVAFPCTVPGTVRVLETATNRLIGAMSVGLNSQAIAITPKHPLEPGDVSDGAPAQVQHSRQGTARPCVLCQ